MVVAGQMYELYDPCTVMFFYRCVHLSYNLPGTPISDYKYTRNKHIMIDLGTGNNNKMYVSSLLRSFTCRLPLILRRFSNWAMDNKQEVSQCHTKLVH